MDIVNKSEGPMNPSSIRAVTEVAENQYNSTGIKKPDEPTKLKYKNENEE